MPPTKPKYSRGAVDRAGDVLRQGKDADPADRDHALDVMSNWRGSHSKPLEVIRGLLKERATEVCGAELDEEESRRWSKWLPEGQGFNIDELTSVPFFLARWLTAQRFKRLWSIENKLARFPDMKLSRMQDVGGCRVITKDPTAADRLFEHLRLNGLGIHRLLGVRDYVARPKSSGYRARHLVFGFHPNSPEEEAWKGHRVEVQVRSKFQHGWATAVETIDAIKGIGLKVGRGEGRDWDRFFRMTSKAIELVEIFDERLYPSFDEDYTDVGILSAVDPDLKADVESVTRELDAVETLTGIESAVTQEEDLQELEHHMCILVLKPGENVVESYWFSNNDEAQATYLDLEKGTEARNELQVCLVDGASIKELRHTFGAFFANLDTFRSALEKALGISGPWIGDLSEQWELESHLMRPPERD